MRPQGVLGRRSEVFSGLFAVPQPENEADVEQLGGCPVVRVQDSLHDFKHFLHALYDGMAAYVMDNGPVKFSLLAALLRLSHKYEVNHIQEAALRRLKPAFPNNFAAWKTYESPSLEFWPDTHQARTAASQVDMAPGEPIEAANLLRRCGYDGMLPVALHMCATLDIHVLLHGAERADGTRETLAVDDLERCLVARGTLEGRSAEFLHRMLDFEPAEGGSFSGGMHRECAGRIRRAWTATVRYLKDLECESEVTRRAFLMEVLSEAEDDVKACNVCLDYVSSDERELSQELWNDLPTIMGLQVPTWPPNSDVAS
ncbi:hypothetical protein VTO73DRAFT_490 [Trametes versicolor]